MNRSNADISSTCRSTTKTAQRLLVLRNSLNTLLGLFGLDPEVLNMAAVSGLEPCLASLGM